MKLEVAIRVAHGSTDHTIGTYYSIFVSQVSDFKRK
jgi:hypothetical protein